MKHLRLLLLISMVLLPALSQAADNGYGYPLPGAYGATVIGTPDALKPPLPKEINSKRLVLEVIPGMTTPEIFYYNEGLRCTVALQDKKAPLVFLIAGTGSSDQAGKMMTLMKAYYQAGFHVVNIPSPTHPNFVIAASHSHIPGDLTEDSADLYWVMEHVWNRIKGDIEVSDFYLGGYSLGGTQAAFVAKLDDQKKAFNFRRVLMINPAVNLYDSVTKIEDTLKDIPGGAKEAGRFMNSVINRLTEFYEQGQFTAFNENFLYALAKSGTFTQADAGGLIGVSFRIASAGMIFASDVMTNGGYVVPKNRVLTNSDDLSGYMRVSTHLSFIDYFNEYFYPYFKSKRPGLTREALIAAQGLQSIEPYLKSNQKFDVITNENDFILSDADRAYLKQLFGERTKIYPRGGHLGNLEYKDNIAEALKYFVHSLPGGKQ
jgi:hypothetical protein